MCPVSVRLMRQKQRIVYALVAAVLLMPCIAAPLAAQTALPEPDPTLPEPAASDEIIPLLPPGISEHNVEVYGTQAYTWRMEDGTDVVLVRGNFKLRMGQHELISRDGVVWLRRQQWKSRPYIDFEVFLWQGAEIIQPGGTIERGPALIVTLRSFGNLVLNVDSHAGVSDADSELFVEGMKARKLLMIAPAEEAEASETPVQVAPSVDTLRFVKPKPVKMVNFAATNLSHRQIGEQSVIIATGDVIVSQGSPSQSAEYVEIEADGAVLYLRTDKLGGTLPGFLGTEDRDESEERPRLKRRRRGEMQDELDADISEEPPPLADAPSREDSFSEWISAVYLTGDVVLRRGQRMIKASELYYDFENDRALILDAVMRAVEPSRGLPIYVRAEQVRQLSPTEYEAQHAVVTTSEFHTPHVAIGASKVYLEDRTPRNEQGDVIGVEAGTYKAYHTTMQLEGTPIAYWPFARGDFSRDRMAFKGANFGYSGDFGATFETRWYLFNLLGMQAPEGYDATLKLDYFTDRGPAVGIDMDYEQDNYFGLLRTYYINDSGEDDFGGLRGSMEPTNENRGRALWRHRQYLPEGWELSLEASYISDNQYLESYERSEFENGKEQETGIYLVKRNTNWQFSALANWRLNEWEEQTEHLPELRFSVIGEPLGDFATLYHDSRAGVVRRRVDNRIFTQGDRFDNLGETGSVVRGDIREELQFPLPELGPIKVTPYIAARATGWDDSPHRRGESDDGSQDRLFGAYGVHTNMMLNRVYEDVESELLDLHRLRHVILAEAHAWNAHSNTAPNELSPFDSGVEDIDDFGGAVFGLRQRWQTKRGGPGNWRTVDWIVFDIEAGFFNDREDSEYAQNRAYGQDGWVEAYDKRIRTNRSHGDYVFSRPEDSISSNFLAMDFQYRISDSTMFVYDGVYDTNRGNMGTSNVSLAVEREPRLSYFVGWRYIHDTNNSLIGAGANYKLNDKHTVGIREYYDVEEGRNYSTELVYVRRWPRWYTAIAFDLDRALDDMGITFSIWPEGAPKFGVGSKRYTGLADSVGIRP